MPVIGHVIFMNTMQTKWDYAGTMGHYTMINHFIIAHLQSFPMTVEKKNYVTSSHTKTIDRIISPGFEQKKFHYTRTK